jgi:hypothetical protein
MRQPVALPTAARRQRYRCCFGRTGGAGPSYRGSMSHRTVIRIDGRDVATLADVLPESGCLKMLMVAKTPATDSVAAGHYFQGAQGRMLWNRLRDYGLLEVPAGTFEDDVLLNHGYGLTDIVKVPRDYGSEPDEDEYRAGINRILDLVREIKPQVLFFVYKRILDQILRLAFGRSTKARYGFNPELDELLGSAVFVFPMPGTPCTTAEARTAMSALVQTLK